jgi:hypothetical protein
MIAESGESGVNRLSPVRYGRKERHISARSFCLLQNVAKCMDWLAERDEFELPVPICEQSDDSMG